MLAPRIASAKTRGPQSAPSTGKSVQRQRTQSVAPATLSLIADPASTHKPVVGRVATVAATPVRMFQIPTTHKARFHSLSPMVFSATTPSGKAFDEYLKMAGDLEKKKQAKEEGIEAKEGDEAPANGNGAEAAKKLQQELTAKDAKLKELEEKVKAVSAQLEKDTKELKAKLLESLAERENLRRIMQKDIENAKDFGIKAFAGKLFDIVDHMNIVITNMPEKSEDENVTVAREAFVGSKDRFIKVMKDYGVEELSPAVGDKFDPFQHSAIFTTPPTEATHKANHIALVFKTGWQRKGQALRPAQVGVYGADGKPAETK